LDNYFTTNYPEGKNHPSSAIGHKPANYFWFKYGESLGKAYVQFVHCTYMYCIYWGTLGNFGMQLFAVERGGGATLILIGI
jgi:hypothetical protein